jgi:hypothetical protein
MPPAYWIAVACLVVIVVGTAVRVWLIPPTRGEPANYDPEFSVLAMAARIIREARNPNVH